MLQSFGQAHGTMLRPVICTSSIFNTHNIATGSPNARNMLPPTSLFLGYVVLSVAIVWSKLANAGPTMLRYAALICCDRLAGL